MKRVLYRCDNQGVTAIAPSAVYDLIPQGQPGERLIFETPPIDYPTPIFTFVPDPGKRDRWKYLTGTLAEMDRLIEGFEVRQGSFYVPFSNGFESVIGVTNRIERRFLTTLTDLLEHFDVWTHSRAERLLGVASSASSQIR